jgi:hypothetical protein
MFSALGYVLTASASDVVESTSIIEEHSITTRTDVTAPEQDIIIVEVQEKPTKEKELKVGWTTAKVNVREAPNKESTILTQYNFNTQIRYYDYNDDWVITQYNEDIAYISKHYISDKKCEYITKSIPSHPDFKSYMGYKSITTKSSKQYELQHTAAYTGQYGIRQINGRYCVAIGSYFKTEIGQYFDLILENGTIIPCVMSDLKADQDTDSNNLFTTHNGCCTEFIVDTKALVTRVKESGSVSSACKEWNSQVTAINIYNNII